jgi:hypothetical protein
VTPAALGGRRYFLLLVNDHSRYMWVLVLGSKGEAANAIRRTQAAAVCRGGVRPQAARAAHQQRRRIHRD